MAALSDLTTFELVVARGEVLARLPVNREGLADAPGSLRPMFAQHVKAMERVVSVLNDVLAARGVERDEEEEG